MILTSGESIKNRFEVQASEDSAKYGDGNDVKEDDDVGVMFATMAMILTMMMTMICLTLTLLYVKSE